MNIKSNVISLLVAASVGSPAAFVSNEASNVQAKLFAEEDFNLDIGNTEPALGDRRNLFKAAGALATANALLPNIASAETKTALQTASTVLQLPKMGLVRAYTYVLCLLFVP